MYAANERFKKQSEKVICWSRKIATLRDMLSLPMKPPNAFFLLCIEEEAKYVLAS
jgi:hypothetical protein